MKRLRNTLPATLTVITLVLAQSCTDFPDAPPTFVASEVGALATEVLVGAGNIATCGTNNDEATASLLDAIPGTVVALGDNAFPDGTLADYNTCYEPTWGRHRARTYPVLGNHEYDAGNADGTFDYFGERAGPRGLGYYSFDLGAWHVIVLNDNAAFVPFAAGSVQEQWLVSDLAANTKQCTLAIWHVPLFRSSNTAGFITSPTRRILWERLYAAGADVVLNGDLHHYERFAPMRPDGTRDETTGMRQFAVGTGGESVSLPTVAIHPNSEVRAAVFGVLKLTLEDGGYSWEFVPVAGETLTDAGRGSCNGPEPPEPPPNTPPTAAFTASCSGLSCGFVDGSADADGAIAAWSWTFGDGATSSERNPSHTYAAGGTYPVRLAVTDDAGATATAEQSITVGVVNQPPSAAFRSSCTELRCAFTDASTDADGSVVAWQWSFGDGATSTEPSPAHTYASSGTYTVQLGVTDDGGGTASTSQTVTVNRAPVAHPGGPYRSEASVAFDGSRSQDPDGDTPLTYVWDFGDGTSGTGVRPTHAYRADGSYTVTVTVTDALGAPSAPARTTATIGNLPPTVNAGADATMLPGFFTLRATFSDPGADDAPWTYAIDWGDGFSSSGSASSQSSAITASHLYLLPGAYRVRVRVTDKDGGAGTDDLVVAVKVL